MKQKLIKFCVISSLLITSSLTGRQKQATAQEKLAFICAYGRENNQTYPTTYAVKSLKIQDKIPLIYWKYPWFEDASTTPINRCQKVSRRFQEAYQNESLKFITNSKVNSQPVICTARYKGGNCVTVLLTLRNSDDPIQILNQLKNRLRGRGGDVLRHGSNPEEIQIYYEIDLENLLQIEPLQ